jgi:hypothetical protein
VTYRQGRDPAEVARELYEEAQAAAVSAEIAYQNAVVTHALAGFDLDRARTLLGHVIEIERRKRTVDPQAENEDVTRARAEVEAAEVRVAEARTEVETRFDQKGEAASRLREAQAEVDRVR